MSRTTAPVARCMSADFISLDNVAPVDTMRASDDRS